MAIFKGRVRVRYGYSRWGYTRNNGKGWHGGSDEEGLDSTTIRMPDYKGKSISGRVVTARKVDRSTGSKTWEWGWYVCVELDAGQTPDAVNCLYFCHNARNLVSVGQRVKSGDALAVMGSTGNASLASPPFAHCHFEVRATAAGAGLDPTAYTGHPNAVGTYGEAIDETEESDMKFLEVTSGKCEVFTAPDVNAVDKHYVHVNPKRDFGDVRVETIRLITAEDCCPKCGGMIELKKGIEVGQVFKLGTKYSEKLGCTYLDRDGKNHPMVMGCYGIGITRTVAASIEQNHDKDGIIWPVAIAPYEVVIVPANNKDEGVMNAVRHLYDEMEDCRDEVILDDRDERAGIKFKDADLIGYPIRVTIGKKWKESGLVEVRLRRSGVVSEVALADCKTKVLEMLEELHKKNL